jgi:hypothetical protein
MRLDMSDMTIVGAVVSSIAILRQEVAEANVRAYGAERKYAEALCSVLPAEWYLVEHRDTSEDAKAVHKEKQDLFTVLKAAKHTNPSTVWARVRKYAQEHCEGPKGEAATGEGEGEGESSGAQPNRSLTLRYVEELTLLFKAGRRAESMSDKERNAHTYIGRALGALGIDTGSL